MCEKIDSLLIEASKVSRKKRQSDEDLDPKKGIAHVKVGEYDLPMFCHDGSPCFYGSWLFNDHPNSFYKINDELAVIKGVEQVYAATSFLVSDLAVDQLKKNRIHFESLSH